MDNRSLPMVQPHKILFSSQNSFPLMEFINRKFLKLYSITLMLESLVNLVTPILECAGM